jgi:hypothetical protein
MRRQQNRAKDVGERDVRDTLTRAMIAHESLDTPIPTIRSA